MPALIFPDVNAEHAFRAPSAADRWLRCARAPYIEANCENESSPAAELGSLAHAVAHTMAVAGCDGSEFIGETWKGHIVSEEMVEHCRGYVARTKRIIWALSAHEAHVDAGYTTGTSDFWGVDDGVLEVRDFKYGDRCSVEAEENPQLKTYAIGVLRELPVEARAKIHTVRLVVDQPRIYGDTEKHWCTTPGELEFWANFTVGNPPPYTPDRDKWPEATPGPVQCKYCLGAKQKKCEAIEAHADAIAALARSPCPQTPLIERDVEAMSPQELGTLLAFKVGYEAWKKGVEAQLDKAQARGLAFIEAGVEVPGQKKVKGRNSREWASEEEFKKQALSDGVMPCAKDLLSPAAAEKVYKAAGLPLKKIKKCIVVKPGKPKLAPTD